MKNRIFLLSTIILAATLFSSEVFAYRIDTAGWRGGSYDRNGRFSHCVVSAKYKRGDRLLFSINRNYVFSIGVADSRWNLRKGDRFEVTLQVDGRRPFIRRGLAVSPRQIVISINDRVTFFRMVKGGRTLRISGDGFSRGYDLRGTSRALNATLRCVKYKLRYADNYDQPRSTDQPRSYDQPRSSNQPRSYDQPRSADGDTATQPRKFVNTPKRVRTGRGRPGITNAEARSQSAELLADAGIGRYKFLARNPFAKQGYQIAWRYGPGKRGAMKTYDLSTYKTTVKDFVKVLSSRLVGGDAKACKGKFVSAFQKTDHSSRWAGRRVMTVCSNNTGGGNFNIRYAIGLQPETGIGVVVVTMLSGQAADDPAEDPDPIDQAIYESSVFRSIGKQ